jgi:hypothetical protein
MKYVYGIILGLLMTASAAVAQVNQGQCTSCTAGYNIVLNGDVVIPGTTTFQKAITNTALTTMTGGSLVLVTPIGAVDPTLTQAQCGGMLSVTAAADTHTMTLPAVSAVGLGCEYTFSYNGANGGALVDISPNASDGINGGITLSASVVYFSGTVDADIGLTKATGKSGDFIKLTSCLANMWCVTGSQGIWANN